MAKKSSFKKLEAILIVTEDTKSACEYLRCRIKALELTNADLVTITPSEGSSPNKVVETAIYKCKTFNEDTKWNGKLPYSKVYCVMDVDDHDKQQHNLRKSIDKIYHTNRNSDFELIKIISNECFEVWYVLHFKTLGDSKPIRRPVKNKNIPKEEDYRKILSNHGIHYSKSADLGGKIFDLIKDKEPVAIKNAAWLLEHHQKNSVNPPGYYSNPSTETHLLINDLIALAQRANAKENPAVQTNLVRMDLDINIPYMDEFVLQLIDLMNQHYCNISKEEKLRMVIAILKEQTDSLVYQTECPEPIATLFWSDRAKYKLF
jgi:hypothetical protein